MKFYILKDQLINLSINEEDDYPFVVRGGTYQITNIIPFVKRSPVANQICKKLNEKLTEVRELKTANNSKDDSGCTNRKRRKLSSQDQELASLEFVLNVSCKKHINCFWKITSLVDHFKNVLQMSPQNMTMGFKGRLNFQEKCGLGDTSNPMKPIGSLAIQDLDLTKLKCECGCYEFGERVVLKTSRSNRSSADPRELWANANLSFTGNFSVTLTVEGIDKKFFMDKDIDGIDMVSIPKKLLTEELDCDVKIILDNGKVIRCHKTFLSAHSQVFASMLNGNFVEGATKEINLPGKTEEEIRALLAYLYHWGISAPYVDPKIAVQLFKIAHEYDIKPLENCMVKMLTKRCSYERSSWLETEMAISLLPYIGIRDDMDAIKYSVMEFFVENWKEMQESEGFREIFENTPKRAMELFAEVCNWKNKKASTSPCDSDTE